MSFPPGTVFAGDYRIERPLSAGGMGAVFVVRQLSTGKLRALKLMSSKLAYDPESRRRFEQEARVGARIASEHVVEVQAAGVDHATGVPYLVMELLEGEDLATRLRRGPLAPGELFTILEQLAHALSAAHAAGVVHRDLKPENIFLGVSRRTGATLVLKVLDFGIAKVMEDQRRTTAAFGTPLWLAPEQTRQGEITPAADVWAFGLLVFTMITGHVFWRGAEGPQASIATVMSQILYDPIPSFSARAAEHAMSAPYGIDAWFARAVAREPLERFPNAREAFAALVPILRAPAAPAAAPMVELAPKKRGAGCWIAALVLLGALAAAALGGFFVLEKLKAAERGPPSRPITADTPAPTPTPTPTLAPSPTVAPTATASGSTGLHVSVNAFVASNDAALKTDFENKLDGSLAPSLAECFSAPKSDYAVFQLKVAADGKVTSVTNYAASRGPELRCLRDKLSAVTFVARAKASDAQASVVVSPRR